MQIVIGKKRTIAYLILIALIIFSIIAMFTISIWYFWTAILLTFILVLAIGIDILSQVIKQKLKEWKERLKV